MPRRRNNKKPRILFQSDGPLPARLADAYRGQLLVFTDASLLRHGGVAAVLFAPEQTEAMVRTCRLPLMGSQALETQAVLFGLLQAERYFPGARLTLFSDNRDALAYLSTIKSMPAAPDSVLLPDASDIDWLALIGRADFCWIKGHSACRGNTLADLHARQAAC